MIIITESVQLRKLKRPNVKALHVDTSLDDQELQSPPQSSRAAQPESLQSLLQSLQ